MNAKIIDWKKLSKTEGFKSLKAAYLNWPLNFEYRMIFGELKRICFKYKLDPCRVINAWEKARDYSWPNWYDHSKDKLEEIALTTIRKSREPSMADSCSL